MSLDDRRVYVVLSDGSEVVRYDRAGKWKLEAQSAKRSLSFREAVNLAHTPRAQVRFGIPGGSLFDRAVRGDA
jgi:hypothetical protein